MKVNFSDRSSFWKRWLWCGSFWKVALKLKLISTFINNEVRRVTQESAELFIIAIGFSWSSILQNSWTWKSSREWNASLTFENSTWIAARIFLWNLACNMHILTLRRPMCQSWHMKVFFSSHGAAWTAMSKQWKIIHNNFTNCFSKKNFINLSENQV